MSRLNTSKILKKAAIFILFILFFILFTNHVTADSESKIIINEIMYNSEENDNYYEYIELFNTAEENINLTGWSITDNSYQDFLEPNDKHGTKKMIIPSKNYAIITDHGTKIFEKYNISKQTKCFYVDDHSIGNGLGNKKDKIILKNQTNTAVDSVEWGYDYNDITGKPANLTQSGFTLNRIQNIDTDDSSKDFYESLPTPGNKNTKNKKSKIKISLGPEYIPKITKASTYSLPFAFKIKISNFQPNKKYDIKTFVVGNKTNIYPATQTWNTDKWDYSNFYTKKVLTDENGNTSFWMVLRFNKNYKEYNSNIKHNKKCYFSIKIKTDDKIIKSFSKKLYLLEMEKTTDTGFQGGYVTGKLEDLDNKIVVVEDETGIVNSVYFSEDNHINEKSSSQRGYYKTYSRVGENYKIKFFNRNGVLLNFIRDVVVQQGTNNIQLFFEETLFKIKKEENIEIKTIVENTGDFKDSVLVKIVEKPENWNVYLEKNKIFLNPSESKNIFLSVQPNPDNNFFNGEVKIQAVSENDPGLKVEKTVNFKLMISDLTVKKIRTLDETKSEKCVFGCGETIKFKAFVKNLGTIAAKNVTVSFYIDDVGNENLIGKRFYENIESYQKYPSVWLDTKNFEPGNHEVFVVVDKENNVEELSESNNQISVSFELFDTTPSLYESNLVISEIYYHSYPTLKNEYICIYNACNKTIDISDFYITDEPFKKYGLQNKITFPKQTSIKPFEKIIITENSKRYILETNQKPDFEYNKDTRKDVPQMKSPDKMVLSNNGENIALKNSFNHTIDLVTYGSEEYFTNHWNGTSIPLFGEGVVLKRNLNKKTPVDTNTYHDWMQNRIYKIGQSNFKTQKFYFNGTIQTFISPDNSLQTLNQLIQNANRSIYINMYEFTNPNLCENIIKALQRNISVILLLEGKPIGGISEEEKYILQKIKKHGGKIHFIQGNSEENIYSRYRFNHAKYIIIDNKTLILESCNWGTTGIPQKNDIGNREWGIIVYNKTVTNYFLKVFQEDSNKKRYDIKTYNQLNLTLSENFSINISLFQGLYQPIFNSKKINGSFSVTPVLSPDNSIENILTLIDSAEETIYIQQLYIYKNWDKKINPLVEKLIKKAKQGVKIKIILNYNPVYKDTNTHSISTKQYLEKHGIKIKFFYTNWSYFTNIHNKGIIVDNKTVLISSINWNENSFKNNRETGLIIENNETARYYSEIFIHDWNIKPSTYNKTENNTKQKFIFYDNKDSSYISALNVEENDNTIYIVVLFTLTFALIALDWRKRKWR